MSLPPLRAPRRATSRATHNPLRILVVEDDAEMRCIVVQVLRRDGYQVEEAADGRSVVQLLAQSGTQERLADLDLIVSDHQMPNCTGMEMLVALRAAACTVPFILMTAFGDQRTRVQAEGLDALFFEKPFELKDLGAVVHLLTRAAPP